MFIMTVKTITVTEEAYNALRKMKEDEESFSRVIIRLSERKKINLVKYSGILSEKRADELKVIAKKTRDRASEDVRKRVRNVHSR